MRVLRWFCVYRFTFIVFLFGICIVILLFDKMSTLDLLKIFDHGNVRRRAELDCQEARSKEATLLTSTYSTTLFYNIHRLP
jgi:hypothetical protein